MGTALLLSPIIYSPSINSNLHFQKKLHSALLPSSFSSSLTSLTHVKSFPTSSKKFSEVMASVTVDSDNPPKQNRVEAMYSSMKTKLFPEIPEMTVGELNELLEKKKKNLEKVVVIDTRTISEAEISMLPGGTILAKDFESSIDEFRDHKIVCYCTIGYRSGMYALDLISRGYNAYNLKGAILAWTHAGYELVNKEGPTPRVHVFNEKYQLQADGYEPVLFEKTPWFQIAKEQLWLKLPFWARGVKKVDS